MIYGATTADEITRLHDAALIARKEVDVRLPNLGGSECQPDLNRLSRELEGEGVLKIPRYFDTSIVSSVHRQCEVLVSSRKGLSRIRNHQRESLDDIQRGRLAYYSEDDLVNSDFKIEEAASLVSIKDPFVSVAGLHQIVFDERLIILARDYFGALPLITYVKLTISFANKIRPTDTQFWHVDYGAKKILKAIVYLSPVIDILSGPFCYVSRSHLERFAGWDSKSRFDDCELASHYPAGSFKSMCGVPGDLFLSETTGFHKGLKPVALTRFCLIFNFGLHPEVGFSWNRIKIPSDVFQQLSSLQKLLVSQDVFEIV